MSDVVFKIGLTVAVTGLSLGMVGGLTMLIALVSMVWSR